MFSTMRSIIFVALIFLLICDWSPLCSSAKVLVLLPLSPRSQNHAFEPIIEELINRKHDVTYVTMYKNKIKANNIVVASNLEQYFEDITEKMFNSSVAFSLNTLTTIPSLFTNFCELLFQDEVFQTFIKNPGTYDVVLVNSMLNECYLPVAAKIGAPIVMVSPPQMFSNLAWALDIPNPLSYLPMPMLPYNSTMTFFQRVVNFVASTMLYAMFTHVVAPLSEQVTRRYIPDAPSTYDVVKNVSLLLINTHVSFDGSIPTMPYVIEVGCIHCNSGKELPADFQNFINGSGENGFIVFSLGTVVKGKVMPEDFVKTAIQAFGRMKQRVIWKYEKKLENLPPNVMTVSWLPQQDLMAHPKCKCAITHGGLLSLQEVAYHGVPLLGIPLGADRVRNIYRASQMGFALSLDNWRNFTAEELVGLLKELIDNPSYRTKAQEISKRMQDRPEHPVKTATFWIEYVIRHKGAVHLKSGAQHLNLFQYYLIDVFALIIVILLLVFYILYKIVSLIFKGLRRLCQKNRKVSSRDKKNK